MKNWANESTSHVSEKRTRNAEEERSTKVRGGGKQRSWVHNTQQCGPREHMRSHRGPDREAGSRLSSSDSHAAGSRGQLPRTGPWVPEQCRALPLQNSQRGLTQVHVRLRAWHKHTPGRDQMRPSPSSLCSFRQALTVL